jgi:asparagine synthase (glutamine-hydrolysing)
MSELMIAAVTTFYDRLRGERKTTTSFSTPAESASAYHTDHHETLINREEAQEFLPLLVRLQDEPIADNVCIRCIFLARLVKQSGTTVVRSARAPTRNFPRLLWCEHFTGEKYESSIVPSRRNGTQERSGGAAAALKARTPG